MNHSSKLALFFGAVLLVSAAVFASTASASSANEPARLFSSSASAIQAPPPPISYTLTISKNGNGSVTPPSGTRYLSGTNATLSATADAGWEFSGWSGGGLTGNASPKTLKMITDTTVIANFTQLPSFSLTTNVAGNGSVAPSGTTQHAPGTVVQLIATALSGWQFIGWSGAITSTANPTNITMDGNKVVTATFKQLFTLTVATTGSGSVAKNPNQSQFVSGSSVQLTASPAAGWQFSGWSGDLGGAVNPGTIVMNANKSVTATFSQIPTATAPTATSQPAATDTPIPLATLTPLLGIAAAQATATITPATGPTLPTTGSSPLPLIAVGLVLVMLVIGSRYLRQSSA